MLYEVITHRQRRFADHHGRHRRADAEFRGQPVRERAGNDGETQHRVGQRIGEGTEEGPVEVLGPEVRITSYNVCYTKLLRN